MAFRDEIAGRPVRSEKLGGEAIGCSAGAVGLDVAPPRAAPLAGLAVGDQDDVAELSPPFVETAAEDAAADPGAENQERHVQRAAVGAVAELSRCGRAGVVVRAAMGKRRGRLNAASQPVRPIFS
jgi:hypothetical protein